MGRQAYLTRLAFGRSAFEVSQPTTAFAEHRQPEYAQQAPSPAVQEANYNNYVQLYDERGNPINPRAREYGRRFREAQNDVLAAIGVVERRRSPSEDLPGAYHQRLEQLENEDSAGSAVGLASSLTGNLCIWGIGSIRDRILTFRLRDAIPFAQLVASEYQAAGTSLLHAGFAARLFATVCVQASIYIAVVLRPLDKLLIVRKASRKRRATAKRWQNAMYNCFRLGVEIAFYPFTYHSTLQRLGLLPPRPLLPSWTAMIPFTAASPIRVLSMPSEMSAQSIAYVLKDIMTSPLLFVCVEHFFERWIYAIAFEVIESTITRPQNPHLRTVDDSSKAQASAILGLRFKSPPLIREPVQKLLVVLGWAQPSSELPPAERHNVIEQVTEQTTLPGGNMSSEQDRHIIPPQTLVVTEEIQPRPSLGLDGAASGGGTPPVMAPEPQAAAPASPTASEASNDDNDPRIRITSREGIVEMEVRLPPQLLSATHEELPDNGLLGTGQYISASAPSAHEHSVAYYHRVTQLSIEPAQLLANICKSQLISWAALPMKLVTLRLIASHYLRHHPGSVPVHSVLPPFGSMRDFTVRSAGILCSRVALCGALSLAVDLSFWGCQWITVTWLGKNFFNWGSL